MAENVTRIVNVAKKPVAITPPVQAESRTKLTAQQQEALYYARKRRKMRLGVYG